MLFGDRSCRTAMPEVVAIDLLDARSGLLQRRERQQALPCRQMRLEARRLNQSGLSGSQIHRRPVAEPAGPELHDAIMGHAELSPGFPDEVSIVVELMQCARVGQPPALVVKDLAIGLLPGRVDAERDFEFLTGDRGQIEELESIVRFLAPVGPLPFEPGSSFPPTG